MKFIEWCNLNQGFLAFILSCCTIFISFVAIIISLFNYFKEYAKKLAIHASILIDGSLKENLWIDITNNGNKAICIKSICILYDNVHLCCKCKSKFKKTLLPSESIFLKYDLDKRYLSDTDLKKHFNIYIVDSYEKEHKCKHIFPAI